MILSLSRTNCRAYTALFDAVTSDKVAPFNKESMKRDGRFRELSRLIKRSNYYMNNNTMKLLADSRYSNVRGKSEGSKIEVFWKTMKEAIDIDEKVQIAFAMCLRTHNEPEMYHMLLI